MLVCRKCYDFEIVFIFFIEMESFVEDMKNIIYQVKYLIKMEKYEFRKLFIKCIYLIFYKEKMFKKKFY